MRPTVAEIDLSALLSNYKLLRRSAGATAGAGLIAVVKANSYGHDLGLCARALISDAGAPWLGVTSVDEALALRQALGDLRTEDGTKPAVLVMSGFFPGEEALLPKHRLTAQVWEGYHFALLDAAARRAGLPVRSLGVHLEIDTGMSRQGVQPGEALAGLLRGAGFEADSPLFVEGVMTHFSSPEVLEGQADGSVMTGQIRRFRTALDQLRESGVRPRWMHAGNSANAGGGVGLKALAGVAREFGAELLVRPGIALYGVRTAFTPGDPEGSVSGCLQPVMRWRTEVISLREIPKGTPVGYNETFRAHETTRLALLPVGYADGLNRLLSNRGAMLVRGQRAPVAGRISMDQTVLDVSAIPGVELGDEVVIVGAQGSDRIAVEEHAQLCGTIPYEVLCRIGERVRRVAV